MRHGSLFGLLGLLLAMLAVSTCALVVTPQPAQHSAAASSAQGGQPNLELQQRQLTETQEKACAPAQPATTQAASETEEPLPSTNPDGVAIAHALPWKGMPVALIGSTYLGEPDEVSEVIDGGLLDGGTPYYWRSRNERRDRVFEAVVRDGEVIGVSRWNIGRNYWPNETLLDASALPILDASGDRNQASATAPDLPDPNDYDDEHDYEADAEDYFAWLGCDDPAQTACLYWESVAG